MYMIQCPNISFTFIESAFLKKTENQDKIESHINGNQFIHPFLDKYGNWRILCTLGYQLQLFDFFFRCREIDNEGGSQP